MNKSEKNVLVINGSPRKNGNTAVLLAEVARGVKEENKKITVEKIELRDLCIQPCRECRTCDRSGTCVVKDDMQNVYLKLSGADHIVLGSPIFFYSVTAWTKAMIDRCQALWAKKYLLHQSPGQKPKEERGGWFIAVGATKGEKLFEGAILTVKYFFDALDVPYRGNLLVRGVDEKAEILHHNEALSQARNLGKQIASF